ncbi:MAG TPA: hypothetical protein VGV59_01230 [Pyrinomonadaceae bacterium]|nr:hypothetical protein [Pyrinomonadaceae bacterium]
MRKTAAILLTLLAFCTVSFGAQKIKPRKHKEKRFEPVVKQDAREYAGRYVGVEPSYIIDVEVDANGALRIVSTEEGRRADINDVVLAGSKLTGTKVYEDGETARFEAEFVDRVLNGERAFGLIVEGVNIKLADATLARVFYRRTSSPSR